jgi:hypothetical protein
MALCFLVHGALDARGQPNWVATYWLTIERDIEIASVVILIALLAISDYYRIPIEPILRWIGVGICFFSVVGFVNSTVLRDALAKYMFSLAAMTPQIDRVDALWNTVETFAGVVSIGIWCYALRKPLPAPAKAPDLLPAEVYENLSPAVNLRLRAFNDRLQEMLKP